MKMRWFPLLLCAAAAVGFAGVVLVMGVTPGAPSGPAAAASATADFKEISWDQLVPEDWDPLKRYRDMNLGALDDSNPRAIELLQDMRATLDNAPLVPAMDGLAVKLPGYVVPLDEDINGLKEFLLVPYFGACIHTPPPPANQIVHVIAVKPAKGFRTMDTVWVSGTLKAGRLDSPMGVSGYRIDAVAVDAYVPPQRP